MHKPINLFRSPTQNHITTVDFYYMMKKRIFSSEKSLVAEKITYNNSTKLKSCQRRAASETPNYVAIVLGTQALAGRDCHRFAFLQ